MNEAADIPNFPTPLRLILSRTPLFPLRLALRRVAQSFRHRHPEIFARLDEHAGKTFLIDPTDLPFVFRVIPDPERPSIEPLRRHEAGRHHARISGPLAALIGMVHGALDGDALFFSRDLLIEGDTEAVLALRNAIDDAEIDLAAEAAAGLGIADTRLDRLGRSLLPMASRLTGVALARVDGR